MARPDRNWPASPVHPLTRFDRALLTLTLYPISPILLFLLGWWVSLVFAKDERVFLFALAGLCAGGIADLVFGRRWVESAYRMPSWGWHLVYLFFSIGCFGFFMGVPVFNVGLGIPAGMLVARKAKMDGLSDDRVRREIETASKVTAVYLLCIAVASACIALIDPYTAANLEGMFNLPFDVTQSMILGLIVGGGTLLIVAQYLVTRMSGYFVLRLKL